MSETELAHRQVHIVYDPPICVLTVVSHLQFSAYNRHAVARECAAHVAAYQRKRKAKRNALRKRESNSKSGSGIISAITSMLFSTFPSKTGSASPPHITDIQNVRMRLPLSSTGPSDISYTVYLRNCSGGHRRSILHQQRVGPTRPHRE